MDNNGISMISNNYSVDDYLDINLTLDSSRDKWNKAITIFTERFEERYFMPINKLLDNPRINGFAIMTLNCLLIDTFCQFENGLKDTKRYNKTHYTQFLFEKFPLIFETIENSNKFYSDIRCGILHSAQTKNGSMLAFENSNTIELINGGRSIKVNVVSFSESLQIYFRMYVERLKDGDIETREKFIIKMNYLCNLS